MKPIKAVYFRRLPCKFIALNLNAILPQIFFGIAAFIGIFAFQLNKANFRAIESKILKLRTNKLEEV